MGEEKRTSLNLKDIIGLVEKISICFPNGGLHTKWENNITYQQEKKRGKKHRRKTRENVLKLSAEQLH